MNTHTPGPWTVGPHQRIITQGWSIRINDDSAIAYALGEKNPELQANARLIAAAPDLLAALIRAIEDSGHTIHGPTDPRAEEHNAPPWVCNARAIIAETTTQKATA